MQIPIIIDGLKSIHQINDEAAQKIIERTEIVRIEGDLIEPKRQKNGFIVEAPTKRKDGLLFIDLFDKHKGIITTIAFDLKTGKFRQLEPDPKPAASAKANPQADPGRAFELALQIGNRTALKAFLAHHPEGLYADLAKAQLEKIETEEAAAKKP